MLDVVLALEAVALDLDVDIVASEEVDKKLHPICVTQITVRTKQRN